jgi:hypothetical protein
MGEMRPIRLDPGTADRLLSGALSPDDLPPGYAGVAQLLGAAGTAPRVRESVREAATVAAMEAASTGHVASVAGHREKKVLSKVLTIKAAAVAALVLSAGTAAAATGSLPGGVQSTASMVLAKVGISVPNPTSHANGHAGTHGKSAGTSGHGHGPSSHADFGLCTAEEAHADSGHQPNAHAAVFPSTTTCTSVPHPGQGSTSSTSPPGNAPSGNADFGLCTAEEAHADSGHQPNAHAAVFPPSTTCTSVAHPGQGIGNTSKPADTSSTTIEHPNGPPPSSPAKPKSQGASHGRP